MSGNAAGTPWVETDEGRRWEVESKELGTVFVAFDGERYIYGFDAHVYGHKTSVDAAKSAVEAEAIARDRKRQAARRSVR